MPHKRSLKNILTPTEFRITTHVAHGRTNKGIAAAMHTSEHTIKNNLRNIYHRTGLSNRVELALLYTREEQQGLYEQLYMETFTQRLLHHAA
jgi:two-component system nitrate/nitrite response regulator NarL